MANVMVFTPEIVEEIEIALVLPDRIEKVSQDNLTKCKQVVHYRINDVRMVRGITLPSSLLSDQHSLGDTAMDYLNIEPSNVL